MEIIILEGVGAGERIAVPDGDTLIGREEACGIHLNDQQVSRRHARLSVSDVGCTIQDLDSRNGVVVNGKKTRIAKLLDGDFIQIGTSKMRLRITGHSNSGSQTMSMGEDEAVDQWTRSNDPEGLSRAQSDLATMYRVGRTINSLMNTQNLIPCILDILFAELDKVDRASIHLMDPKDGSLICRASQTRSGRPSDTDFSKTVLDQVVSDGRAVLTRDARNDRRFKAGESVMLQNIHSAVCAPLRGQEALLGAIYVDTLIPEHMLDKYDLQLLMAIGLQAGTALENARLYEHLAYEKAELHVAHNKLKMAQDQLVESAKMAAVGQLASGLIHDIKNPMSVILGYTHLVRKAYDEVSQDTEAKAYAYLDRIEQGVNYCNEVLNNLLTFARARQPEKRPVNINEVVDETFRFLQFELNRGGIHSEKIFAEDLPRVWADPNQLKQVFLNMMLNALQAINKKPGHLEVATSLETDDTGHAMVCIAFSDNGKGMRPEQLERIFEPFFTTKVAEDGKPGGSGLGLSVSRRLIEGHGGRIEAQSCPGEGTTFSIYLPVDVSKPGEEK